MTRYLLTVLPDGRAILSTELPMTPAEADGLKQALERWRTTDKGVAILANTRVEHATSIELDLRAHSLSGIAK